MQLCILPLWLPMSDSMPQMTHCMATMDII